MQSKEIVPDPQLESAALPDAAPVRKAIYLSGPMTGIPAFNFPAFHAEAARLRALGRTVFNPAESGLPASAAWSEHMRADLRALLDCDHIHMLPGWSNSTGAWLELQVALALGFHYTLAGL